MNFITAFWITFINLTWWQFTLVIAYTLYFCVRAYAFWEEQSDNKSFWKGYRRVIFGFDKAFRVYHIVRILFDIPPAIIGLTFPLLRKVLAFKIYEFKDERENK
jgi:hypothetical protein